MSGCAGAGLLGGGGGGGGLPDLGSLMGAALQLILGFASGGGGAISPPHSLYPAHALSLFLWVHA